MTSLPPNNVTARRIRWTGLALGAIIVALVAAGAALFYRSEKQMQHDPGRSSRTPDVLDKMLARADEAERAGDRGAAIAAYRFVVAVGSNGDPAIDPYIAAALRGLARLGASPQAP